MIIRFSEVVVLSHCGIELREDNITVVRFNQQKAPMSQSTTSQTCLGRRRKVLALPVASTAVHPRRGSMLRNMRRRNTTVYHLCGCTVWLDDAPAHQRHVQRVVVRDTKCVTRKSCGVRARRRGLAIHNVATLMLVHHWIAARIRARALIDGSCGMDWL